MNGLLNSKDLSAALAAVARIGTPNQTDEDLRKVEALDIRYWLMHHREVCPNCGVKFTNQAMNAYPHWIASCVRTAKSQDDSASTAEVT